MTKLTKLKKMLLIALILIVSSVGIFAEESSRDRLKRLQEKSEKMLEKALDLMYEDVVDVVGTEGEVKPKELEKEFDQLMQEYLKELEKNFEENFKKAKPERESIENLLI